MAILPVETVLPIDADARNAPAGSPALHIEIPALPLAEAIAQVSRQGGVSIGTDETLPVIMARRVHDAPDVARAFAAMLAGSGLVAHRAGPTAWRISLARPSANPKTPVRRPYAALPANDDRSIVVTAAKRPQPFRDIARSVTVARLSAAQKQDPAFDTAMVGESTEGLTLTSLGPGRNRMFLRGVADSPFDGASQSTVAVLVDDSRLTYSAPDPDLRLVDVDRVELLKGPQGSLYGTGALGGIYHIVTNRANLQQTDGAITAEITGLAHGGVGATAALVANLALAPDAAGFRLVAYASREPGWIDTGPRRDSDATHVEGGRVDLGLDPGAGWRIDVAGLVQYTNTADSQYTYAAGARSRAEQLAEPHDNDLNQISVRATGPIGAVDAVLVTSYSVHEVDDTFDATTGANSFGLAAPRLFQDFRHYTVWDSEARFTGKLGSIQWLAGFDHVEAAEHELRNLTAAVQSLIIDDNHRISSDTGLFADLTLPLGGRLAIDAGGRLYRSELHATRDAGGTLTSDEVGKFGVTPSAALIWRPRRDRLLWLRYGSAFRQGGLGNDSAGKMHAFTGDDVSTIEAGWREQSRAGQFDADTFVNWWHDIQSDILLPNGLIETRNAGQARIFGAEASLSRRLGRSWQVSLGASVQSARLVQNQLGIALEDRRLPVIPVYTLRGQLERNFRFVGASGRVGLMLRYLGPSRLSFDPRLDRPMGKTLDSRFDASLDWGRTRLDFKIENLLDRAGDTFAFGNPFRVATPQYTPQPPLRTMLGLTRQF